MVHLWDNYNFLADNTQNVDRIETITAIKHENQI